MESMSAAALSKVPFPSHWATNLTRTRYTNSAVKEGNAARRGNQRVLLVVVVVVIVLIDGYR